MNKGRFSFFTFAFLMWFCLNSKSQEKPQDAYVWSSVGFEKAPSYVDVIGSIYLFDDWHAGIIKLENGKNYDGVKIKYDQLNDQLNFLLEGGKPMLYTLPIKAFDIVVFDLEGNKTVLSYVNGFPPIDGATSKSYYQVFDPGSSPRMEFVKRLKKVIYERSVYSSAVKEKLIEDRTYYYMLINNKLCRIKRNIKELLKYMSNHKAEVNNFIAKSRLTFKSDTDFADVVKYYNSLL